MAYFMERKTPADSPDTLIEVSAPTRDELVGGVGVVIQYERERGEVVTWPHSDQVVAVKDAELVPSVFDGAYHVATVLLRFT